MDTGIDTIDAWARAFGFGEKTGIDLPNESSGIISGKEYKMQTFGERWWPADTAQTAIGQLYNNFTPIQIASYTATLASAGNKYTPHVVLKIVDESGDIVYEGDKSYTDIGMSKETGANGAGGVDLDGLHGFSGDAPGRNRAKTGLFPGLASSLFDGKISLFQRL